MQILFDKIIKLNFKDNIVLLMDKKELIELKILF